MTALVAPALTLADPAARTPAQWSGRLAAYLARGRANDDPEVVACRQALAFWRARRAIDAEAGQIAPNHLDALTARLREAVIA
ncbi:hypothetical protein A5645_05580 [Mycobacterium asiaticum]|uniref:hypothetical protein n=1 Tax=Mycobacterium asiaticum TaxID=1790 RepID=UPI0007EFB0CD|nr:hypothetical protein [Mycobacterium asiaticum]OBK97764.1 hypothetical protein A5645_05580 [Mycobacterium asiaticum]